MEYALSTMITEQKTPFFANRKHDSDTIQEGRVVKIAYLREGNENLIFELSVKK